MAQDLVVGVDIGSSGARAVALDAQGAVVATGGAGYGAGYDQAAAEVEPTVWLGALVEAVASLDVGVPLALGVGGQSPTTVASSGTLALTFRHPAGDASSPADQHLAHAEVLSGRLGGGTEPRLLWDYLVAELGGDPTTQSVWPQMAPLSGFGDPVPVGTAVGSSSGSHGFPEGVLLVPGSNDAYLTLWASGIDAPGKGFDPGGRAGGLGVATPTADHEALARYGMPSHIPGLSVVGGPVAAHGALIDWWSEITGRSIPELLDLAGSVEPGATGVMALPYVQGARAPRWNREMRGLIDGLTLDADVATVTRALLEATAYGLAHIARTLAAQGVHLTRVVSSGAPSRSVVWTSIKASVLEVEFDVPSCAEMAAYGAALAAGAGMGWWPRPGEGRAGDWPVPEMTTIEPEPSEAYRQGLERFIDLGDRAEARTRAATSDQ